MLLAVVKKLAAYFCDKRRQETTQMSDEVVTFFAWEPRQIQSEFSQRNDVLSTVSKHITRTFATIANNWYLKNWKLTESQIHRVS